MTGCPYSVRVFNWSEPHVDPKDLEEHGPYSPETNFPPVEGTVGKCVFCADKLRNNQLPRCVTACPMGVIYFGDMLEDTVTNGSDTIRLSTLLKDKSGYRYLEELGTQPSVYYLPPVNRKFPVERGFNGIEPEIVERYKDTPYMKKLEENE
jgi:molybdopterin-containing oxidoreductase family iron-sulfur binding subunit